MKRTVKKHIPVIGLTGGIASGKSTIVKEFESLGASVIDADRISREISRPGTAAWKSITRHFGRGILNPDRTINRKELGKIVFADDRQRKLLERITHPAIIAQIQKLIAGYRKRKNTKLILVDAALLYEARLDSLMDKVVVVWAPKETQVQRLMKRDGLTGPEAAARIRAQWPLAKKRKLADYVIDNSFSVKEVKKQVKNLWGVLTNTIEYV